MASPLRQLASTPARSLLHASKPSALRVSGARWAHPPLSARSTLPPITSRLLPVATLHASARRQILPPLPLNDPVAIHEPHPTHGSYHWAFERLVSLGLIPLTVAPFIGGSLYPVTDALLCGTLLVHSHIGFQSVIIDYVPKKRMPRINALFWWGLRLATVSVGLGLYEYETNDVGLTETIKRLWTA